MLRPTRTYVKPASPAVSGSIVTKRTHMCDPLLSRPGPMGAKFFVTRRHPTVENSKEQWRKARCSQGLASISSRICRRLPAKSQKCGLAAVANEAARVDVERDIAHREAGLITKAGSKVEEMPGVGKIRGQAEGDTNRAHALVTALLHQPRVYTDRQLAAEKYRGNRPTVGGASCG